MNSIGRILTTLAALGLAVSIYLTFKTYDPSSVACSIGGGCETVLSSKYAYFIGIPVSVYGIAWYLVQIGLLYLIVFRQRFGLKELRVWALLGLAFSLYLLAAEIFLIHAYCTWCLVSLAIVVITTILLFLPNLKGVRNEQ